MNTLAITSPIMTVTEQLLQTILTVLTTLPSLPVLYVLQVKELVFPLYIGVFTLISCFMYHLSESLEVNWMYLDVVAWHKLDNVSGITFLCSMLIHMMDNTQENCLISSTDLDLKLELIALCLVLLMQTKDPWKLVNTLTPICLFVALGLGKHFFVQRARVNWELLWRGLGFMTVAFYCFLRGLKKDYLRTWHGLWHCFCTYAAFYLWQSVGDPRPISYAQAASSMVAEVSWYLGY